MPFTLGVVKKKLRFYYPLEVMSMTYCVLVVFTINTFIASLLEKNTGRRNAVAIFLCCSPPPSFENIYTFFLNLKD